MVGWIVALISGVLMSIQGVLNTEVTKQTSLWVSTGWVQLSALIVCITAWLIRDRSGVTALMDVSPKYMLLGGVIGAFITLTVIVSMDQLGPARAAQLIVVSQIAAAYLIELFGLFGVDKANFQWSKVLGLGLSVIGIMIVKWK
ncbi:DMT family transporter [Coprococcus catus]|uniref:DMT family transporter n=1 Tax=Coprococcus catus TaxID=116085 RepID=UPI0020984667|nr:DMT family transporter [Coprococcus catus]MCO7147719.1 DMT family transporter [Coprococcus catus]